MQFFAVAKNFMKIFNMSEFRIRTFFPVLSLFGLLMAPLAQAVPNENQDVWRVHVRPVAFVKASEETFHKLDFYRWENNRWQPSDAGSFFDTQQADVPLIVYVPGYSLTTQDTTQVGFTLVQAFDPDRACRVVFWDWFSDKGGIRIRRDLRHKIPIGYNTANYLALLIQKLEPESKVCLFGFSFGSRIVCDAADALRQSEQRPEGLRLNLVLSGAATDQHWFAEGQRHSNVPEIVERILVTYNPDDWVLWYYPLMYSIRSNAVALGLDGLPMQHIAPEFRDQFESFNVERYIGHRHLTVHHIGTPVFQSRIGTYFFFE